MWNIPFFTIKVYLCLENQRLKRKLARDWEKEATLNFVADKGEEQSISETSLYSCSDALFAPNITKEGNTRWIHKLRKNFYIKNSIYFALLMHRQEYRNELEK
jgi:hypothetical protein